MLSVIDLQAGYRQAVLQGLSFSAGAGELIGLVGPNGAGKSTLLRAIAGIVRPRSGEVLLFDRPVAGLKPLERARLISLLPQTPPSDADFSVRQVVEMGRHPHQRGWGLDQRDREAVDEAMACTGMTELAHRRMDSLSGGEQQRARLAQALAQQPRLLLLDEPTAWADLGYQIQILSLALRLARTRGMLVLASLHDLNHAAQFCDRLLLLQEGRLVAEGSPGDVFTGETIAKVYGVAIDVLPRPDTGRPYLLPRFDAEIGYKHDDSAEGRSAPT